MHRILRAVAGVSVATLLLAACAPPAAMNARAAGESSGVVPATTSAPDGPWQAPENVSGWLGWWERPSSALLNADDRMDVFMLWLRPCGRAQSCTIDANDSNNDGNWGESLPVRSDSSRVLMQRKDALEEAGHRVWVTVVDDTPDAARAFKRALRSAALRKKLANRLVQSAAQTNAHGIDLDLESLAFATRQQQWDAYAPRWDRFVRDVARAATRNNIALSVTVPVGVGAGDDGGYRAYEWSTLGKKAQRVNLMTYDYSYQGTIAPLPWVDTAVRDAARVIPARKLRVGITTVANSVSTDFSTCPDSYQPDPGWERTRPTWSQTSSIVQREGARGNQPVWLAQEAEYQLTYPYPVPGVNGAACTVPRVMHYLGEEGVLVRSDLAARQVRGVAIWGLNALPESVLTRILGT